MNYYDLPTIFFVLIFLFLSSNPAFCDTMQTNTKPKRVVLIGASVGRAWDLPNLPQRIGTQVGADLLSL